MKKKILCILIIGVFTISFVSFNINAKNNSSYSWYCKRTKDHARPPLPKEFEFINNNDAFYIGNDPNEKVVFLTFDAGYENGNVTKTLDILKSNNVTGAFFILSNLIKTSPEVVKRMRDEGHIVCNHTGTHKNMSKIKCFEEFEDELLSLEALYAQNIGGEVAKFFRPPEGRFSEQTLIYAKKMGYKTIFWSFAYADWDNNNQMSKVAAEQKIMGNLHNGAVILLHPTSDVNTLILDKIIKEIKDQGYRFGTLDELTRNA